MFKRILQRLNRLHPAFLMLFSYLAAIGIGIALLMLPAATVTHGIPFIDALFTATSAVCVTGLIVLDTAGDFTRFGQTVILGLIQLGGLGIMTLSVMFFHLIGLRVLFQHRMAVQEIFSHTPRKDIYTLLKSILVFTAAVECCGTLLLFFHWWKTYPLGKALFLGLFHAVSAFCNAGFSLFSTSFIMERTSIVLNLTVGSLIVLGGLGFPVVFEIYSKIVSKKGKIRRFSIQTKAVLWTSGVLIVLGAVMLILAERRLLQEQGPFDGWMAALFQSVTCRTAGFNTVDIAGLNNASLAMMMFLMFFGASPGSCGGGVKTTTLAVLAAFSKSRLKGWRRVSLFKKTLPEDTTTKALSMVLLSIGIVAAAFFLLLLTDMGNGTGTPDHSRFLRLLFETISAFGTVGLSMGATSALNPLGKLIIIAVMVIGRVGVPTFAYIITGPVSKKGLEYAQENLMIG